MMLTTFNAVFTNKKGLELGVLPRLQFM